MKCPKCDNKELRSRIVLELEVDQCPSCSGIWFDETELSVLLDADHRSLTPLRRGSAPDEFDMKKGKCPRDGEKLLRVCSSTNADIVLDSCGKCRGIWLDGGEFGKIKE